MERDGFYRVAAAVPVLALGDPAENAARSALLAHSAASRRAKVVLFPECGLTGYTCGDLFDSQCLQQATVDALDQFCAATRELDAVLVLGAPLLHAGRAYNCALVIQHGEVHGVVPKTHLPNYREFYEKRWFSSGAQTTGSIHLQGKAVPFGVDLLFACGALRLGIEICEDLWHVIPPSSTLSLAGANVLLNLSASHELVSKADYRRQLVQGQSARCMAAYLYASAGPAESTTDLVFGGHTMIAENGAILAEGKRFQRQQELILADLDLVRLEAQRRIESSFSDGSAPAMRLVSLSAVSEVEGKLMRPIPRHPFVPAQSAPRAERCEEIFHIQATGLARRWAHTPCKRLVIGISGGLDSTLALLVASEAAQQLQRAPSQIIAITMPGFGTTGRTYDNAVALARHLGVELREVCIKAACLQHFQDIGHDPADHTVTYENVQARERTQVLMDVANREGGLVVGTGDLSEVALGWSTYNGDHMSMYGVNGSVPKTLIRYVIAYVAESRDGQAAATLQDILDTPISPELLPAAEDGSIQQKTEDVIGPYELHDFFLYHAQKYGARPAKILRLATQAFHGTYTREEIAGWLRVYFRRFFSQQFKRSCFPDGPKVGSISLSPRGDWRMPSDAQVEQWLHDLDAES